MRRKDEERREAREREKKKRENIFLMEGREKFNKIIFFFSSHEQCTSIYRYAL